MTFCYSNNGASMRPVDPDYAAQSGEVLFPDYATAAQLGTAFPGYAAQLAVSEWVIYQAGANAALAASDKTILRCCENSVQVPADWAIYRKALRAIVGSAEGDPTEPLPVRPAYPVGT